MITQLQTSSQGLVSTLAHSGLSRAAAEALADIPHDRVTIDPRRPFREPGAPRNELMLVEKGVLAKCRIDASGKRQIVAVRYANEGILPTDGVLGVSISAIVPTTVLIARDMDFERIIGRHPEVGTFFLRLLQRESRIKSEWLMNCGRRDSMARVAHFILEMARRTNADAETHGVLNPFTQADIADMTGQTSVNVNRMFARLERDGLIRREGRRIFIARADDLKRVAGFEGAYLD